MTGNHGSPSVDLLGHARAVLAGRHPVPRSQAARAAAVLARQALEDTVRGLSSGWGITDPRVNMRSKLVSLRVLGEVTVAELVATAWWGLSSACHHHAYDLTPTSAEIQHLIDQVARLIELTTDNPKGDNGS